jgi:hypothetical protein
MLFFHAASPDGAKFTEDEIIHFLNARSEVTNWTQLIKNVYAIDAMVDPRTLNKAFRAYVEKNGHAADATKLPVYTFIEIRPIEATGILPKGLWPILKAMGGEETPP